MSFLVFLCAVLKNTIYGLSVFFVGSLTDNVDVLDVLALRYIISFAALTLLRAFKVIKIRVRFKDFFDKKSGVSDLLLAGLFEPCLYMFFETMGISMTTGITAGVIISLSPVANCFTEAWVLKVKAGALKISFLIVGIIGAVYIAIKGGSAGGEDKPLGILFMFLAIIVGAFFSSFSSKSSKKFSSIEITYITVAMGLILFNGVNVVRHLINGNIENYFAPYFNIENISGFIFLGIISTCLATFMNNYALSKITPTTMAAFGGISTLVTVLGGVFLGGENIYYYHYIGFALILFRMISVSVLDIYISRKQA